MSISSTRASLTALSVFLFALLLSRPTRAQESYAPRKIISMHSTAADFREIVAAICDPSTEMVPDTKLKRSNIYFRLTERRFVLTDGKLNDAAFLGGTPYVFLSVPQAGFGRSLYEIYSDLGYDAEGVLEQRNVNMVGLVIRYQPDIQFSPALDGDGALGQDDFKRYVYVPTWKNAFALFAKLASEMPPPNSSRLEFMQFDNDSERNLARFFPAERRTHLALLPYALLRATGGADWDYRQLLETKMSMNSHFRGVGTTENTLSPADNRKGLPEFVGPNRQLSDLQDYAVIDFGRMEFTEVHD